MAIGLGALYWLNDSTGAPPPNDAVVQVGAGPMTDARFVELTKEVLGADPRYHTALYEVMDQVIRETTPREASTEYTPVRLELGGTGGFTDETGGEDTPYPSPV